MPVPIHPLRWLRVLLLVAMLAMLLGATPAHGSVDVFVYSEGGLFVGSGAEGERNRLDIGIKSGEPETAPTTIRVRDTTADLNAGEGCVKVEGASRETTFVDCEVTDATVEVAAGPGDDSVEILTSGGPVEGLVFGDAGKDFLQGGSAGDRLLGGDEGDILRGGPGDDQLYGEEGVDLLNGQDGSDLAVGGAGADGMEDTGGPGVDSVTYSGAELGVRVTVADGECNDGQNAGAEGDCIEGGFERVQGTSHDDVIEGGPRGEIINGSRGDDDLDGKGGADRIEGNEGEDTIRARDGAEDPLLDCDSASSETQGTRDRAIVDEPDVDPEPLRCETVERPDAPPPPPDDGDPPPPNSPPPPPFGFYGSGPPPARLPALTALPTISGELEEDGTVTCSPGTWTGSPAFAFGWFVLTDGAGAPRRLATGQSYRIREDDAGESLFCAVLATNAAGSVVGRSALAPVPQTVRLPSVNGLSLGVAKDKILKKFDGKVGFATEKGRSIDAISCEFGGLKGDCERARLKPGDAYNTEPKRGKRLVIGGAEVPKVRIYFYDAGKDETLSKVTPKKYGDDCPISGRFSDADRESFLNSVRGKYEAAARALLVRRECRFSVRYEDSRGQEADPYVRVADTGQVDGERGIKLTVSRPKIDDLAVVTFHRRLKGADTLQGANLERGPINAGIGVDGRLTTLRNDANDVCFAVVEASTGRLVPGVEVRARNPSGESVNTRFNNTPQGGFTNGQGVNCESWRIDEEGTYHFTFVKRGDNGVNEEGYLDITALERSRSPFNTLAGRSIECSKVDCVQRALNGASVRARASQLEVLAVVALAVTVSAIVRSVQNGRGVDGSKAAATADALAGPQPEASLFRAARTTGVTPGILTTGGKLDPSLNEAPVVLGTHILANDGASILANDGASILANDGASVKPQSGGNVVVVAGKVISQDGSGLIGQDGSGIVSGGAGNLLGQDGSSLISQDGSGIVSGGAGNVVQLEGRAVLVDDKNRLAAGTIVSAGGGNAIPVAPIVPSTGGG